MNHYMYFDGMTPNKTEPSQNLRTAIIRDFGSMQRLCQVMKTVAISQFGSGYAWLMYDSTSKLRIVKTPNQDPPAASYFTAIIGYRCMGTRIFSSIRATKR